MSTQKMLYVNKVANKIGSIGWLAGIAIYEFDVDLGFFIDISSVEHLPIDFQTDDALC